MSGPWRWPGIRAKVSRRAKSGILTYFQPDSFVRPRHNGDPSPRSSGDLGCQGKCRAAGNGDEKGDKQGAHSFHSAKEPRTRERILVAHSQRYNPKKKLARIRTRRVLCSPEGWYQMAHVPYSKVLKKGTQRYSTSTISRPSSPPKILD